MDCLAGGVYSEAVFIPEERVGLYNSLDFQQGLESMIAKGYTDITIDFSNVTCIDCAAMGVLFKLQKTLNQQQGKIKVTNVNSQHVRKIFKLIKLHEIITVV